MKILVTGAAGFIGFHLSNRLMDQGDSVVGLDNLNAYYDPNLKLNRLKLLETSSRFQFVRADLTDRERMASVFAAHGFDCVVHLAAQAGVRYSLENPFSYTESNVSGTLSVLEGCRHNKVGHLVYASSSSVYGANTQMPFSVHQSVDHPLSLYAATKKSTELMAHCYSHLYHLPTTGLRFFTVYGPWGRPDMALFLFSRAILKGEPIEVFNHGRMSRDLTFVADVVEGIVRLIPRVAHLNPAWDSASPDPASSRAPYRLYNIGAHRPVDLMRLIDVLEDCLGRKAIRVMRDLQPGDVPDTYADVEDLSRETGYEPTTQIEEGVEKFVRWYVDYYSRNRGTGV
jgi:UDP-glucuronate 4-epimerase